MVGRGTGRDAAHHFGLEGRLNLPRLELRPVDVSKERVLAHFALAVRARSQALLDRFGEQLIGYDIGLRVAYCTVQVFLLLIIHESTWPRAPL